MSTRPPEPMRQPAGQSGDTRRIGGIKSDPVLGGTIVWGRGHPGEQPTPGPEPIWRRWTALRAVVRDHGDGGPPCHRTGHGGRIRASPPSGTRPDANDFDHQWNTVHRPTMLATVDELRAAAATIERNVSEQRTTSQAEPGRRARRSLVEPADLVALVRRPGGPGGPGGPSGPGPGPVGGNLGHRATNRFGIG